MDAARSAETRCRTLIVEDDQHSKEALAQLLRHSGCEVKAVGSLGAAFGTFIQWRPRCVVLDLMLPDGNGVEFLRTVRAHEIPVAVAVVTGSDDRDVMREVDRLRPDATFLKPLDLPLFLDWLSRHAGEPSAPV
jgi:DNA-binding response OmpR family regulator